MQVNLSLTSDMDLQCGKHIRSVGYAFDLRTCSQFMPFDVESKNALRTCLILVHTDGHQEKTEAVRRHST